MTTPSTADSVGMMIRGSPSSGAYHRATTLYSVGPSDLKMIQSCASAAKLLEGGPILETGFKTMAWNIKRMHALSLG